MRLNDSFLLQEDVVRKCKNDLEEFIKIEFQFGKQVKGIREILLAVAAENEQETFEQKIQ